MIRRYFWFSFFKSSYYKEIMYKSKDLSLNYNKQV